MNLPETAAVLSADEIERLSSPESTDPGFKPLIEDLEPKNLKGAAYDLRMGTDGMVLPGGTVIRPRETAYRSPVVLEPGQTAFISTLERLNVPHHLTGNMSIKGELAGRGVLLLTGLIVDPGYDRGGSGDGRLHFRLANLGKRPVLLEPGKTKIASIQVLRLDEPGEREPGHSFDDVWKRVDELHEGLGFLEDLRTLDARVTGLEAEMARQGRSINLVVVAVMAVVVTTLLGTVIAGLLTLGSSVNMVESANRVVPDERPDRILGVVALFGLAAIVAAGASIFRVRREAAPSDPAGVDYARTEALRDLRAERARSAALAGTLVTLLAIGAAAVALELNVPWWFPAGVAVGLVAIGLWEGWDRLWWPLPRWRVDERVRDWEREALERGNQGGDSS
jgi:deoxycytidine triphosphate deaminase